MESHPIIQNELKKSLFKKLQDAGYEIVDFVDAVLKSDDDYPDYEFPLAGATATGKISLGIAVLRGGVGVCIAANKKQACEACLIHEKFSAHRPIGG